MDSRDDLVPMVRIKEIAPRLAGQAHSISTEHKVELIDRLTAAGVRAIEATSFVRPDLIPGLADAEQVLARVRRTPGVTFECCVGNELGIRRAAAAGADRAWFLLSADERFARDNIGRSTEESLELLDRLAEVARDEGIGLGTYVIFAWGGPDGPARGGEAFEPIGRRLREVGVEDWILADSAGYASPRQLASLVECAAELTDMAHLTVQIHDARGMGLAGVATLVRLGLRNIDTSLAGSGGHPAMPHLPGGGVCTEDVVQMLDLLGVSTGIDLAAVVEAANWLEQELGVPGLGYVRRVDPVPTAAPGATTIGHFHWTEI